MCKRALKRDNGPEKRAQEVKLEEIPANTWGTVSDVKCEPRRIAWVFAWAVIWMLRSIEVVNVKVGHVNVDWKKKTLRLKVPKTESTKVPKWIKWQGANPGHWGVAGSAHVRGTVRGR